MGRSHTRRTRADSSRNCDEQLVICAARLNEYICKTNKLPQQLTNNLSESLTSLTNNPDEQAQLAIAQHFPILLQHATDPTLRLRLCHLIKNLSIWLRNPTAVFPILSNLCSNCTRSTHPRDTAALSAIFRAISYLVHESNSSQQSRDAIEHAIPTLARPLSAAIVHHRPAALATHADSSATDDTLGSLSVPGAHQRIAPIRPDALAALIALASKAPRSFIPFWSILLPDVPAISQNPSFPSHNLATIILYEPQDELRSAAVTAAYTLIVGTRSFIRNIRPVVSLSTRTSPSTAFTSSSTRVLNTCSSMYIVIATALRKETSGVVVAKLARLATELLSSLPLPTVPMDRFSPLFCSLCARASDLNGSDLTARAAVLRSLATAITHSGPSLEYNKVEEFLIQIVEDIKQGVYLQLEAEILSVLTKVIEVRSSLFDIVQSQLSDMMNKVIFIDKPDYQIHMARLLETYVSSSAKAFQKSGVEVRKRFVDEHLKIEKAIATVSTTLYELYFRIMVQSSDQAVRLSTLSALSNTLKLMGSGFANVDNVLQNQVYEQMKDIILICQRIQLSESSSSEKQAAVKTLGFLPTNILLDKEEESVIEYFLELVKKDNSKREIREKVVSSLSNILERSYREPNSTNLSLQLRDHIKETTIAVFNEIYPDQDDTPTESAETGDIFSDAFRVGCINLIKCCICISLTQNSDTEDHGPYDSFCCKEGLLKILNKKDEAVFVRSSCCHAIKAIFECLDSRSNVDKAIHINDLIDNIEKVLQAPNPVQLQASATQSLEALLNNDKYHGRVFTMLNQWLHMSNSSGQEQGPDERKIVRRTQTRLNQALIKFERV